MLLSRVRAGPLAGLVLSVVFAAVMTLVLVGEQLWPGASPSEGAPTAVTLRIPVGPGVPTFLDDGPWSVLAREQLIIPRGTVLRADEPTHATALSWLRQRPALGAQPLLGSFALFFTLSMALGAYLRRFGQSRLRLLRSQIGLMVALLGMGVLAKLGLLLTALPQYWIPISAVPVWVASSFDRRTAFVVTVVLGFSLALLVRLEPVLLAVLLSRGMAATLYYLNRKRKRHMVLSCSLAGLSAALIYIALRATFDGSFGLWQDLRLGEGSDVLACAGGGLLAGLLAALLRAPLERLFGRVSRERLLDLTDLEQPILQKIAQEAPGTWEHSRAMANLAEQAASAIGADALLTRVGAYYHDAGKTAQAKYFVENLGPDDRSPHDALEPDVSADAIMAHVVIGTKLLREGGAPEPVVEFAYTHHGTQLVEYFWERCKEQGNPKGLAEEAFRYPGMKPQTKETAILMLVDSIEAASRTIDPPERGHFEAMVQRVLFTKLASGQLDDSGLELADLRTIATRMTDTLVNMNHHRIKYPWQAKTAHEFGVPARAVRQYPSGGYEPVGASTRRPKSPAASPSSDDDPGAGSS